MVLSKPNRLLLTSTRITYGGLNEQVGLFDSIGDKMRVSILLDLLGRKLRVRAPVKNIGLVPDSYYTGFETTGP
jgi:hypothetical protein